MLHESDLHRAAASLPEATIADRGVWTRDLSLAHQMVRKIKAGMVGVNMHGSIDPALPFGGFKQSGWGREKGRDVLDLYTEVKSVVMAL